MAKLFDTHAHYTDEKLMAEPSILADVLSGDIGGILTAASDLDDSRRCITLSSTIPAVYAAAGIHPHECGKAGNLADAMTVLSALLGEEKVVALGEIGLDYHYDFSDRETQMRFFRAQMEVAAEKNIPVIIHDREAHGDVFSLLSEYKGKVRGILHSCSVSAEMVRDYVRMGYYISFSGTITFKNASGILDAVRVTPQERILVETDCPYLAPVPMRGKMNHSGYLHFTAERAADLLGIDYDRFCEIEMQNAKSIFGIA